MMLYKLLCVIVATTMLSLSSSSSMSSLSPIVGVDAQYASTCDSWTAIHSRAVNISHSDPVKNRVHNNFAISQTYQEIGVMFSKLVGMWHPDTKSTMGVWPTMAAFASNTVGFGIRGTMIDFGVAATIRALNKTGTITQKEAHKIEATGKWLADHFGKKWIENGSVGLGQGNMLVFIEIGLSFSRYGMQFCNVAPGDMAAAKKAYAKFVSEFKPNQKILRQGFDALFKAQFDASLSKEEQAQYMLLSSLYVGLDEQTRLQPAIVSSMPPPIHIPIVGNISISAAFTKTIMVLNMAQQTTFPGKDMVPRPDGSGLYSHNLSDITVPELVALFKQLQIPLVGFKHTAADDWIRLSDRMRYVGPLFRGRLDYWTNSCHIFSEKQRAQIAAGQMPDKPYWVPDDCVYGVAT